MSGQPWAKRRRAFHDMRQRMDQLRAIAPRERTAEQAAELERLHARHVDRVQRAPKRIAELEAELAELRELVR